MPANRALCWWHGTEGVRSHHVYRRDGFKPGSNLKAVIKKKKNSKCGGKISDCGRSWSTVRVWGRKENSFWSSLNCVKQGMDLVGGGRDEKYPENTQTINFKVPQEYITLLCTFTFDLFWFRTRHYISDHSCIFWGLFFKVCTKNKNYWKVFFAFCFSLCEWFKNVQMMAQSGWHWHKLVSTHFKMT